MDSLRVGARELRDKIARKGLKNFVWLRNYLKKQAGRTFRGSRRDPLLYLGLIGLGLFLATSLVGPLYSEKNNSLPLTESSFGKENTFLVPGLKVKESPDLSFIQKNSLAAVSPPIMVTPQVLGALVESVDYQWAQKEVTEYLVQPGDNLWSIAEKFNISLETLLWANNLNKNSLLQIDQKLIILPTSGVIHHVQKGDTLSEVAKTYKADVDKIIAYNDLLNGDDIQIGDILIVPDGLMPPPVVYSPQFQPLASSYFICPVSQPCRITQGLHWYNALDFSHGTCGEPIYAAAAGNVLKVKLTSSASRWAFGGAGNYLTILHPNGVVTSYGHLQTALVKPGDYVYQGQIIALMGGAPGTAGAGKSTGCHVHFGVSGARNPFSR